jgi:hypothetical protein
MFAINRATCTMGKISNNLETHGDEDVPAWTIPLVGILIDAHTLEELLHDCHASEGFFKRNADGQLEPRPWVTYAEPIALTEAYDGLATSIKFGDELIEFDRCRLKDLTLGRFFPGAAQLDCKLQLYPGLDHANLVLQAMQNHPIVLTIESAKVAAKKKLKQQELPLMQAAEAANADDATRTDNVGATDPLYDAVVTFVTESRITSVSGVQAQFGIDYARASLLLGFMEVAGILGPVRDDHSREILDGTQYGPGDDDEGDDADEDTEAVPTSRVGRAVTAHAKRQSRKRARTGKNGDARAH